MRIVRSTLLPLLLFASGAAFLFSCTKKPAATGGERLVIITPHWEGIRDEYEAGFQQWLKEKKQIDRAPKLEWLIGGGSSDILRQIENDFAAGKKTRIDVVFGGGLENFLIFKQKGYLEKAEIAGAEAIPADLRGVPLKDKDSQWFGAALSAFGIMYNNRVIARENLPQPKEWADLARPQFRGRVGVADPRHSGSFLMMCEIMLQANGWERGWEILTGMVANARSVSQSASDVPRAVGRGEVALGAVIDFYARQVIAQSSEGERNLGYVIPAAQTVITPDPIGILKGAPNRELALRFVEYVLSDGQKLLMLPRGESGGPSKSTLGRLAVLPDLYSMPQIREVVGDANPFQSKEGLRYDEKKGSGRRKVLSDMIGTLLIDNRTALQRAWGKATPKERRRLGTPPISERQALALAQKWDDATFRNSLLAKWASAARGKFS